MPKIKKPTGADISALTSDVVAPKKYRNRLVISRVTFPKPSNSEKKKEMNDRFADANQYAKHILKLPGMKELYAKGISARLSNTHTVAVSDYLNAPVIHAINIKEYHGTAGDKLRIRATDDFQVTSVEVRIRNKKGDTLEKGEAVKNKRKPRSWVYTTTVNNPELEGTTIEVTAKDRPGNEVDGEVVVGAAEERV